MSASRNSAMSTRFDVRIIYGFPYEPGALPVNPDSVGEVCGLGRRRIGARRYDVEEFAALHEVAQVQQFNAGLSNGGSPDYFLGVEVIAVTDCTRGQAWAEVPDLALKPDDLAAVLRVATALGKDLAACRFYLLGDAA